MKQIENSRLFVMGKLWLQWSVENSVGWFICLVIMGMAFDFQFEGTPRLPITVDAAPIYEQPLSFVLLVVGVAVLMGVIIGLIQWSVVKRPLRKLWVPWLLVTTAGWLIGILAGLAMRQEVVSTYLNLPRETLVGGSVGLFTGFGQWWLLRHQFDQSRWWIGANTIEWAVAFSAFYDKDPLWGLITYLFFPGALTGLLVVMWFDRLQVDKIK